MNSVLRGIRAGGYVQTSVVPAHLWYTFLNEHIDSSDNIAADIFTAIVWPEHDDDVLVGRGAPA